MSRGTAALAAMAAASLSLQATSLHGLARADWSSWLPFGSASGSVPSDAKARLNSGAAGALVVWGGPGFGRNPRVVADVPPMRRVAIHDGLCAAVSEHGSVFVVEPGRGEKGARGREGRALGARHLEVSELQSPGVARVRDVALRGADEVVALGENGAVSVVRRRGPGEEWEPGQVLAGAMRRARIDLVRCGERHCVALASDGSAYAWGDNSKGQCGIGSTTSDPTQTSGLDGNAAGKEATPSHLAEPVRIELPPNVQIVDADCGDGHTALLSRTEVLHACGDDHWMQLGVTSQPWIKGEQKPRGDVHVATCVQDVAGDSVSCGGEHTFLVARDGTPWSWGENSHGQLAHHNIVSFAPPNPIANFDLRAVASRAGRHHSCVLSEGGRIYCIGEGVNGQLGSGPLQRTSVWRELRKLSSGEGLVVALAAGGDGTAAILAN